MFFSAEMIPVVSQE